MRCLECGAEMRHERGPVTESYRGEAFTVDGIDRWVCDACGNDEMTAAEAEKLARGLAGEYARAHGLLSPDEVRALRTSLGLRQKDFERLMGVSSPTASRWETGAVQQSVMANKLMTLLRDCPAAREQMFEMAEVHDAPDTVRLPEAATPGARHDRPERPLAGRVEDATEAA